MLMKNEFEYDIDVKDLERDGFYSKYEEMDPTTSEIVKSLIMDAALGLYTGRESLPAEEIEGLLKIIEDEPANCRPIWPADKETSLEMAAFLNGYCLRYPDMTDTQRMVGWDYNDSGHPSDMIAAIFALADKDGVSGAKLIEAVNVGYKMWNKLSWGLLKDRRFDYSIYLSFVVPVMAAIINGDDPQRIQDALDLSVISGLILGRVRSTDDITNMKSAAAGCVTYKSLWGYRMSSVIKAPETVFTGNRGSWFKVVNALDRPFVADGDQIYQMIELKSFPCFNCAQAPVECGVAVHDRLNGDVSHITKIALWKSEIEAKVPYRPDRPKYPYDHPTADHHMEYCVDTGILYGELTPKHYEDEYINSPEIRHLIDITELNVFTEEELAEMDGNTGASLLKVYLDNGEVIVEKRVHATGNMIGIDAKERVNIMHTMIEKKRKMIEHCYGYDLSEVDEVIFNLENHSGKDLVDIMRKAMR